jgi:GNAT superfamily N-acetyltransferase
MMAIDAGGLRVATADDLPAVTATIATAFLADPVWGPYSFPDEKLRLAQATAWWETQLRDSMRNPWTLVSEGCEAVAVWTPPGQPELSEEGERQLVELTERLLGAEQAGVVLDVFEALEHAHPHDPPHFYLGLLGTHRDHRGKGLGMRLLAQSLELIDERRMPAYLESTNPDNNRRYAGVGFEAAGQVVLANGHVVTTMWRGPR